MNKSGFIAALLWGTIAQAQPIQFDKVEFIKPMGWNMDKRSDVIQLSINEGDAYDMVGIYAATNSFGAAKENFNQVWEKVAKQMIPDAINPQPKSSTSQNGWEILSGSTSFKDGVRSGSLTQIVATQDPLYTIVVAISNTNKYQPAISAFIQSLKFLPLAKEIPQTNNLSKSATSFSFTTTTFDDGWIATAENDFVNVTKGNFQILIHYPNAQADAYNSVLRDGLLNAWNILVAPRYSNIQNFALKPIQSFESISFAEADATERATGKKVHVVLFKKHFSSGNGRYLEFTAPDRQSFEQEFGPYHNDEFGWDKLSNMQYRNKFAVAAPDLSGTWSASDYASLTYYYVNGGGFAGATATSIAHEFTFNANGTYQSDHAGASGTVGNQKFSRQVYSGQFSIKDWNVTLSNRFQGQPESYACQFEAVKGGRILLLTDRLGTVYTLVKRQ